MSTWREWIARLLGTLRAGRSDADLREELQFHAEMAARGPAGADGGTAQAMEALRDQREIGRAHV